MSDVDDSSDESGELQWNEDDDDNDDDYDYDSNTGEEEENGRLLLAAKWLVYVLGTIGVGLMQPLTEISMSDIS
jgi:hypothetical protein